MNLNRRGAVNCSTSEGCLPGCSRKRSRYSLASIPVLVKAGLFKPLAAGPRNCVKYFPRVVIEKRCDDVAWLDKASKAVLRGRSVPVAKRPAQTQADASNLAAA